jgi:puromycin-sensitive aminopeptidase
MGTSATTSTVSASSDNNDFRLPRDVTPSNYRIWIEPDLDKKVFAGEVIIDVTVHEPVDRIVLNAKQLEVGEAYATTAATNGTATKLFATVTLDPEREFAKLAFNGTLGAGEWQLVLRFSGIHNDKLKGFYSSSWKDEGGKEHKLVVTQLESTDARRAFPCFDEPEFKATYEVSLSVPKDMVALSNGRVVSDAATPGTDRKLWRFRKTMKMSTYLVAFIVGKFEPSETVFVNGIELRAWAVPGKRHLTSFALRAAAFGINYFEKYFRVKYPDADKCDLIAIPDFAAGAMENKDCITFRETALLLDESTATHAEKERVAEVVMHELAHMWFGDLVTMRWWNGLWLNEAFATFMAAKCADAFRKDWRTWDGFGISRAAAARVDALNSTHPIESPVVKPEDAQELFDVISYQKGCSVLYQIEQFIGEEVFRDGITHYLNTHAFGSTETHDLWDSLELACREAGSKIPVRDIMDKWVFIAGHPLLSVKGDPQGGFIRVEQQQFKFLPGEGTSSGKAGGQGQLYPVPVRLRITDAHGEVDEQKLLIEDKEARIYVGEDFQSVVLNAGGSGFYRVKYDSNLAQKLIADGNKNLSVIERFNLVNDSWSAVRAGLLSATEYLDMIKLFAHEDDINVWSIIIGSLHALRSILKKDERTAFQEFIVKLCKPMSDRLGWQPAPDESAQTRQLRGSLLGALGTVGGDKQVIDAAQTHFGSWLKDKSSIDSNILPAIVSILAYNGDQTRYEEFKKLSGEAKTPQEQLRFLYALAGFRHLDLLKHTFAACLDGQIKTQDAPFLLGSASANEVATEPLWEFIKTNWESLIKAFPETGSVRMCSAIIPTLDSPEQEKDAQQFFAAHKLKAGDMAIAQALEQLRINVLLRQREAAALGKYALASDKRTAIKA